jgi:ABC-2 type transport system ATP-binding protein
VADFAVDIRDVSKRFRLAHGRPKTVKERIIHGGKRQTVEDFWALSHVSLRVAEGETVGILGRNGSGKSTLLKCVCGVLQPTSGEVAVRGKLAGLLELGAGFQQDLTGRENVYLNGSLLGMTKREVDRVFDAIVDFSELEEFIDGQVKFYSSGMYVRLAFAVAVNVDPDILVVDEVLAVGDERFQRKCIDRVLGFQREGRTILLVTHSADQVRSICNRGIVLSHGELVGEGEPGEATRIFREGLLAEGAGMSAFPTTVAVPATPASKGAGAASTSEDERPVRFTQIQQWFSGDNSVPYMCTGDALTIVVGFAAFGPMEDVVFSLEIRGDNGGMLMRTDTSILGSRFDLPKGVGTLHFGIEHMPLLDGNFTYALGIQSRNGVLYDWLEQAGKFEVMNPGKATGMINMQVSTALIETQPMDDPSSAVVFEFDSASSEPNAAVAHIY